VARFEPKSTVPSSGSVNLAIDRTRLYFFDPTTHAAI
jgi:hypothetical protein